MMHILQMAWEMFGYICLSLVFAAVMIALFGRREDEERSALPSPEPKYDGKLHVWTSDAGTAIAYSAVDAASLAPGTTADEWGQWPDHWLRIKEERSYEDARCINITAVNGESVRMMESTVVIRDGKRYLRSVTEATPSWWIRNRGRGLLPDAEAV